MLYKYNKIKSEFVQYKNVSLSQKFSFIYYLPTYDGKKLRIIQGYLRQLGFSSVYVGSSRSAWLLSKQVNLHNCLIIFTSSVNNLSDLPVFLDIAPNQRIIPFAYRIGVNIMSTPFFNKWHNHLMKLLDIAKITNCGLINRVKSIPSVILLNKFNFFKFFFKLLKTIVYQREK